MIEPLGASPVFYQIELWFHSHAFDEYALAKLGEPRGHFDNNKFKLWRGVFVRDLMDWSWNEAAEKIADSLSLRCFVRAESIDTLTPSAPSLRKYHAENKKELEEIFFFIASLWLNSDVRATRARHVGIIEDWARRKIQGKDTLEAKPESSKANSELEPKDSPPEPEPPSENTRLIRWL